MTATVHELLDAIDRLPEAERHALAAEILRRTADEDLAPPGDEDLLSAAEDLFLQLDAREAADAHPSAG